MTGAVAIEILPTMKKMTLVITRVITMAKIVMLEIDSVAKAMIVVVVRWTSTIAMRTLAIAARTFSIAA